MRHYTGIIFDFNGVLIWDGALQEQSWKDFSAKLRGFPLTEDEMRLYMHGRPNGDVFEYLLNRKINARERETFIQEKEGIYRTLCLNIVQKRMNER